MDAIDTQARQLVRTLRQALTSSRWPQMLSQDQFGQRVAYEKMRADRIDSHFCLLLVSMATRSAANCTGELREYLLGRKRLSDDLCQMDDLSYVLLLPDTSVAGARSLADDISTRFGAKVSVTVISYPSGFFDSDDGEDERESDEEVAISLDDAVANPLSSWKRLRDVAVSFTSLVILAPAFVIVALIIKSTSRGPVIHRQQRIGFAGKPFMIYKFRSMFADAEERKTDLLHHNEQDGPAFKIADDPRITKIGRILRKYSIDEFPQLWNVLKGDMTLVGPRPLPTEEMRASRGWQKNRLAVMPGLTCTWQVEGRSTVSFSEWMRMDLRYIYSNKLFHDTRLILKTIQALVVRPNGR